MTIRNNIRDMNEAIAKTYQIARNTTNDDIKIKIINGI